MKLSVLIGGDDRELQAALKRAQSGMKNLQKEMRSGITDAAKWSGAMAAAGAAIATYMVKQSLEAIDAQAKLAKQLNTTVSSMATIERAAELDGVAFEKVQAAAIKMQIAIGQAAQGTGPAADALKRLQLNAEELSSLPLDQRISAINEAIKQHIPLSQQASVASEIFGANTGAAMLMISPETLREATRETQLFGTALNDIDSRKVELANDSFSKIAMGIDGFWKQIAVQVSPILLEMGTQFERVVEEAGGMEKIATEVFDNIVTAAGFVMDAVDGIGRVFVVVGNAIKVGFFKIIAMINQAIAATFRLADKMPGVDFSETIKSYEKFTAEAQAIVDSSADRIEETLMRPMPSEGLKRFVEEAKKAAEEAAKIALDNQKNIPDPTGGGELDEKVQAKLDKLRDLYRSEEELLFQRQARELEQIAEFESQKAISQEEAAALREAAEDAHWMRMHELRQKQIDSDIALEKARNAAIMQARSTFMSNLAGLMNTQSRKVFEFGKKAAIAEAAVKGSQAVMDAWQAGMSTGGPWAPIVAAGYASAAAVNAANLINNIRSQQFGGGGTPRSPTQGSSNVSPTGAGGGSIGGQSQTTIVQFSGTDNERDMMRRFVELLNENSRDGGRFIIA